MAGTCNKHRETTRTCKGNSTSGKVVAVLYAVAALKFQLLLVLLVTSRTGTMRLKAIAM